MADGCGLKTAIFSCKELSVEIVINNGNDSDSDIEEPLSVEDIVDIPQEPLQQTCKAVLLKLQFRTCSSPRSQETFYDLNDFDLFSMVKQEPVVRTPVVDGPLWCKLLATCLCKKLVHLRPDVCF